MFKNVHLILLGGGDGVPFPFNPLMGYLSGGFDRLAADLAVSSLHPAYFIILFLVFCNVDDP